MNIETKSFPKNNRFLIGAGLTLLGWAAGSSAVTAADGGSPPSIHVSYGDLNLDSDAGAKVLYARIRGAANEVCNPLYGADLARRTKFDGCVSAAITSSVAAVNNARVTAMHNESVKLSRGS
jgi:UrcA family protein